MEGKISQADSNQLKRTRDSARHLGGDRGRRRTLRRVPASSSERGPRPPPVRPRAGATLRVPGPLSGADAASGAGVSLSRRLRSEGAAGGPGSESRSRHARRETSAVSLGPCLVVTFASGLARRSLLNRSVKTVEPGDQRRRRSLLGMKREPFTPGLRRCDSQRWPRRPPRGVFAARRRGSCLPRAPAAQATPLDGC